MKRAIIDLCKPMFKAALISLLLSVVYWFLFALIITAIFKEVYNLDFLMRCINMVTYSFVLHSIWIKKRYALYSPNHKFNFTQEAKYYFFTDGKNIMFIYAVLTILCEIDSLLPFGRNPIVFICSMFFPFFSYISIPILRSIVSLLLANIIPLLLIEYQSYKINKNKGVL